MNDDTLLLRQIHPRAISGNVVWKTVFIPSESDKGCLSVYDGDKITPEEAWIHYTEIEGRESKGVMAVTVAQCKKLGLSVISAPTITSPAHALIDFTHLLTSNQIEKIAKKLRNNAQAKVNNGWLYYVE